ncbi:MAG: TIGR01212 family radical SAM protein [Rikenellaceae bacterium]
MNAESKIFEWGDNRPWNSYSRYFKSIYGQRIQKVAINAGFTCPNRDGSKSRGGCTFCSNDAFNPSYCDRHKSITAQIEEGIEFHSRRYQNSKSFLAYFQAYSNTYAPLAELKSIYNEALTHPDIIGVVIGTRPDCIDEEKLDYFATLAQHKYVTLEYGVESCHNTTLQRVNRADTIENAIRAIELTKERGLNCGAHFILGLPGESKEMMIEQTDIINSLKIDTIKFHQLQVFKNTLMEREYSQNSEDYHFFELQEYINLFIEILTRLRPSLIIERFAGEAPPRHVAYSGNWGKIRNEQLVNLLEKELKLRGLYQGCRVK